MSKIHPNGDNDSAGDEEFVRENYMAFFGHVPPSIETRLTLGKATSRMKAVVAIERLREVVILESPLDKKVSQLVQFGQLLALGKEAPARLHARAAKEAGAKLEELLAVVEISLITSGMPQYALGVEILNDLVEGSGETP